MVNRGRLFDILLGVLIGTLGTGAASTFTIGQRVASLEVEVKALRRDMDKISEADIQLQENKGISSALSRRLERRGTLMPPLKRKVVVVSAVDDIERVIDNFGLHDTLALIAEICHEKAEHIETNWQDRRLAATWDRAADAIDKVAYGKTIKAVP